MHNLDLIVTLAGALAFALPPGWTTQQIRARFIRDALDEQTGQIARAIRAHL